STKPCEVSSGIKKTTNGCPYDCGICENHKSAPCICLIDITNRCNLACPICFANASAKGYVVEPSFNQIVQIMKHFRSMKPTPAVLLQLSGGEPTVRDDLPDIVRKGKELGFIEVMVTTNGVRLGKSKEFCKKLVDAGMDAVYLQFDATDAPEVWKKVRGVNLWPLKQKAIQNLREVGFKGIMLVPTVARGVNDNQIGAIMDFAKENNDVIAGVVFQPVSLCGRINYEELMDLRYTTSDLKIDINKATNNAITRFYPIATTSKFTKLLAWFDDVPEFSMTSHADCGFATICVINDKNEWEPIENYFDVEGLIRWSNKVYDMVREREIPKPTSLIKGINLENYGNVVKTIANFIDDMTNLGYRQMMKAYYFAGLIRYIKNPTKLLTSKTLQSFAQLIMAPNLSSAGNFLLTKNLMISAMHFQDAYNFDLERVSKCLVHYGVINPEDPSKVLEIPFCAMNTLHRERLERANAIPGEKAERAEVIQNKIETFISSMDK
ncbi:MAG: radical SAM protein, partial [Promethearchaeota archaeon]